MLSKNQIKNITSLKQKKYRIQNQLFIAEGFKVIDELIHSDFLLDSLYCLEESYGAFKNYNPEIISEKELFKISGLTSPNKVLGIFKIPDTQKKVQEGLSLALDGIKDPGNLGTIIRLCDWFGVSQLICSNNTVDCYNPKVVQATMGSLGRLPIIYTDLLTFFKNTKLHVYGSFLNGTPIHDCELKKNSILLVGNESNGISDHLDAVINTKITIPKYSHSTKTESLNVATATAIMLNEFRKK
jgi:TrmH family RNA methyltransferase